MFFNNIPVLLQLGYKSQIYKTKLEYKIGTLI